MGIKSATLTAAGKVSIFGWLDSLPFWSTLWYPIKGALLRGLKSGLSVIIATLLADVTAGTLLPTSWSPVVIIAITLLLQAADKYIREWNIDKQNTIDAATPIADPSVPTSTDAAVPADIPSSVPTGIDPTTLPDAVNTDPALPPS